MPWEKVEKPKQVFKSERLSYPTPRSCTSCGARSTEMAAIWYTRPNPPGKSADATFCLSCYYKIDPDSANSYNFF